MMKRAIYLLLMLAMLAACSGGGDALAHAVTATPMDTNTPPVLLTATSSGPIVFPKIDQHPDKAVYVGGAVKTAPVYNPDYVPTDNEYWQIDLRSNDISSADLTQAREALFYAVFNTQTVWPLVTKMPGGFDPNKVLETGKDPGMGVDGLHAQGITGKGVGIAIIDQPLLVDHQEYASQLRLYEALDDVNNSLPAGMHGTAVASIAVGKTTGVAPEADLYFIATFYGIPGSAVSNNMSYGAKAIRRILQINQQLPADRKIRVISISTSWTPNDLGYSEMVAAVKEAEDAGMLVLDGNLNDPYAVDVYDTLGRTPLDDPNDFATYTRSWLGQYAMKTQPTTARSAEHVMVLSDSHTTASPTGVSDYVFYRIGGENWAIPILAGVYALAVQVDPQITPAQFWDLARSTGRTLQAATPDGKTETLTPVLDPAAIIQSLKK